MASSSLYLSLNLSQHPKLLHSFAAPNSLKPLSLPQTHLHKSFFFNTKSQPLNKNHIFPKPISNLPLIHPSFKPHKSFCKKIVILLVGSFIFMGSLRIRPVLAHQPMEETSFTETQKSEEKDEQEMYLKVLLDENPTNVEALKMIVNVKMRKGKTKEAVEYVERLIKIQPREVEWRLLQALCYEMMGQLSMAKKLFKDILKQRPLLLRALHGLAMVMHKNYEGPAVFEMLESALELARRDKRVNEERNIKILIAQMHVVKGELEEALGKFQILVNENPRDFRPYLCQGIIYSLLDKKKEAEEQFEIYRSLVPDEFPQRGFLDDVMMAAKTESREQLEKEFKAKYSYKT